VYTKILFKKIFANKMQMRKALFGSKRQSVKKAKFYLLKFRRIPASLGRRRMEMTEILHTGFSLKIPDFCALNRRFPCNNTIPTS
jgi:hypothetical protein